ncbi:hypothetical protein ACROYT_G029145 [Oculina patagonica]
MEFKILIFIVSALLGTMYALNCPDDMFDNLNFCCKFCPVGTFLKHPCNESKGSSFCEPCPRETYMDKINNITQCEPCRKCGPSQVALVSCEPSHNRECGCAPGKYHDPAFLFCMDCRKCTVGEGVVSQCTQTSNTKCQPCPKGTFSSKESYEEHCIQCSKCEPGGIVLEECNASRDTICQRANVTHTVQASNTVPTAPFTASAPTNGGNSLQPIKNEENKNLIYVLGISFAVVFVIVIVFAIYCLWRRRRGDEENEANNHSEMEETKYDFVPPTTAETPAHARSSHGLRGRRTNNSKQSGHQRDSDSQGSSGSLQGVSIGNGKSKILVRELPGNVFVDLGLLLNPKSSKNWITLAGHLKFTANEVKNLELCPEEATQRLLGEWGQRDGSTVDILINILKKMKRDDCLEVLKQWDT